MDFSVGSGARETVRGTSRPTERGLLQVINIEKRDFAKRGVELSRDYQLSIIKDFNMKSEAFTGF